ncbi:MAG: MFS transporter [Ilumatobacteraceae bacterium]
MSQPRSMPAAGGGTDRSLLTREFLAVTVATGAFFIYVGMLVPLLPTFIEDELGAGEVGIGLSIAMFALAAIAVRPVIARLIVRYGRRAVIIAGALIAAMGGGLIATVDSLVPLLALRAVTGIGEAAVFVGAATVISDLAPPDRRAESASYFSVAVFTGLGIGPVLGELVLDGNDYPRAFAVAALFPVLAAVLALGVQTSPPQPTEHDAPVPKRTGLARVIHPSAIGPGLVLASGIGSFAVFTAFLPDHARTIGLAGSGGLFTAYSIVCLVVRITGARLPERLGARRSVTIALSMTALALAILASFPYVWALWTATVVIGVGMAFQYPSLMALAVNRVGDRERPAVISSFTMFFEIGTVSGGLAFGVVAELTSKRAAFAGCLLLCGLGLWLLRTRVAPLDEPVAPDAVAQQFIPVAGD